MNAFAARLIFAVTLVMISLSASAATLSTYDEIAKSLESAIPVYLSVDVKKCSVDSRSTSNSTDVKRFGIKISSLYERNGVLPGTEKMRMLATGPGTGLFGNQFFEWTRDLTLIFEDGTVMILNDNVDPASFKLIDRLWIDCKLSSDGSGGVKAFQMPCH